MTLQISIFDADEKVLVNQPVELLQDGQVIAKAVTDASGVARFLTAFKSAPNLAIRYNIGSLPR